MEKRPNQTNHARNASAGGAMAARLRGWGRSLGRRPGPAEAGLLSLWFGLSWLYAAQPLAWRWGDLTPSVDVTLALLVLALTAGRWRAGGLALLGVTLLLSLLRLVRTLDGSFLVKLGRRAHLASDLSLVPEAVRYLFSAHGSLLGALALVGLALAIAAYPVLTYYGLRQCQRWLSAGQTRRWALVAVGATILLSPLRPRDNQYDLGAFTSSSLGRLGQELWGLVQAPERRRQWLAAAEAAERRRARIPTDLGKLRAIDVVLIVIESYGSRLFVNAEARRELEPRWRALERQLRASNYDAVTQHLETPVFGGGSWLSHATLDSGIWVDDQTKDQLLLNSRVKPLPHYFNALGHHTLAIMPAVKRPWPEGDYFDFRERLERVDFEYVGPSFTWSPFPDQYAMQLLRRRLRSASRPLFAQVVLTSSHTPWLILPRYTADWEAVTLPGYYTDPSTRWQRPEGGGRKATRAAYLRSIAYELDVLLGFVSREMNSHMMLIVVGDHEPAGVWQGTPRRVPMHVLARPELLDSLRQHGFHPGLIGDPAQTPHRRMDEFLELFLQAYSNGEDWLTRRPMTHPHEVPHDE